MYDLKQAVLKAKERIKGHVRETPLDYSISLSKKSGAHLYFKCENLQFTGSFKVRGAFNKILSLNTDECRKGVVTASTGNHGAAVARALSSLKIPGLVCVPENASSTKVDNIRNYNIPLEFHGSDCVQAELYALAYAREQQMVYLSPYNDLDVIAGQGTIGEELIRQLPEIDAIFVPIGGGGLIAGIAGYIKAVSAKTKIIGCMPENSPVMLESIKANQIVEMNTLPTLSDATAGGIEPGSITFELCKELVDDYVLVSEEEIKAAIINMIKTEHRLIEGAAGVALAALFKTANLYAGKNVVVVLSGANISFESLSSLL